MLLCFDVLIQYLCTLAISDGFQAGRIIFKKLNPLIVIRDMTNDEWQQILYFITAGGKALQQYDEYKKIEIMTMVV